MTARIILVRHGLSAHRERGWHTSAGARSWLDAYAQAGLARDESSPAALVTMARAADAIYSSDLPRAIESARLLAGERPVITSALLREAPMPVPELGQLRLPLAMWALLMIRHWRRGRRRGVLPSAEVQSQARDAALQLHQEAGADRMILVVTHATIRGLIATELKRLGWSRVPGGSSYAHWGAWTLQRPESVTASV